MSTEAWRRRGTDLTPRLFAWQAYHFQHLRLDLCGRRGFLRGRRVALSAPQARFVWQAWHLQYLHRYRRKLGDEQGLAGVALSALQARFVWQAWHLQYLHRCRQKLGDEQGLIFVWSAEAWRRTGRGLLRDRRDAFGTSGSIGRRDTFGTSIDVRGSLATNGGPCTPRPFA